MVLSSDHHCFVFVSVAQYTSVILFTFRTFLIQTVLLAIPNVCLMPLIDFPPFLTLKWLGFLSEFHVTSLSLLIANADFTGKTEG